MTTLDNNNSGVKMDFRANYVILIFTILFAGCSGTDPNSSESRLPTVSEIVVSGSVGRLNPGFSPEITAYSVISNGSDDSFSLSVVATDTNNLVSVNEELVVESTAVDLVGLNSGENIKITVEDPNGNKAEYNIVYLPSDFPDLQATIMGDGVAEQPIYMDFFNPQTNVSYATILDNNAVPIFFRRETETSIFDFKYHPETGERSFARLKEVRNVWGNRDFDQIILNTENEIVETVSTTGLSQTDNHDFHILPNNELLLLSYDGISQDLSAFGLDDFVEESVVQIIDRTSKEVKFEWRSLDEIPFDQQLYDPFRNEYAHINSAIVDTDGNILVSLRGTSQIVKIDRTTGTILWILGGKSNQFNFVNDPFTGACGQHDVSRLTSGNILVFDNGQQCLPSDNRGELTRITEYELDEVNLEAKLVWSYSETDRYSIALGSATRLSNGNTLIGWGRGPDVLVSEIDADKNTLFEIRLVSGWYLNYRTRRFDR